MNRRKFLKTLGLGAGAAFASPALFKALASPSLPPPLRTPATVESRDPVWHLLNRIGFGPTPGQVEAVKKMGVEAYIERQINAEKIDDGPSETRLLNYLTLYKTGPELIAMGKKPEEIALELVGTTVMRGIYSEAQLGEVITLFWSEHFSIWHKKDLCAILKTLDDREVIRKYSLARFRELLGASAHSAAMLFYLDNSLSHRFYPNENYAREIMELHTITIGNYTEDDVKAVAKALTGWTFVDKLTSPSFATFAYYTGAHDTNEKVILGQTFPAGGGVEEGDRVLDILAAHPATAHNLATKLCRRFVADDPPGSIVSAAEKTFTESGGDIKAVLRTIIASEEFKNALPKYKRPFEYLVSLCRAIGLDTNSPIRNQILKALEIMGHLPFNWPAPNGYSDYSARWIGNMLERWTMAINAVSGSYPGTQVDLIKVAESQGVEMAPRAIIEYFAQHMLGQGLAKGDLDTLYSFAARNGEPKIGTDEGNHAIIETVILIAASPAFQYR